MGPSQSQQRQDPEDASQSDRKRLAKDVGPKPPSKKARRITTSSEVPKKSVKVRVREFNNHGAACVTSGLHRIGWELLKGALELELAAQKHNNPRSQRRRPESGPIKSYVGKAEEHRDNIKTLLKDSPHNPSGSAHIPTETPLGRSNAAFEGLGSYDPFLYSRLFLIPEVSEKIPEYTTAKEGEKPKRRPLTLTEFWLERTFGGMIIFNLAWVEHANTRRSQQAQQLYQLAASLSIPRIANPRYKAPSPPISALGVAILNNWGVWCYENNDIDRAQQCMEHLSRILDSVEKAKPSAAPSSYERTVAAAVTVESSSETEISDRIAKSRETTSTASLPEVGATPEASTSASDSSVPCSDAQPSPLGLASIWQTMDEQDFEGFRNNIRWILHTGSTSPAA